MDRGWWGKLSVVLLVALGSIWFLVPTYYSLFVMERKDRNNLKMLEERMPRWAPPARNRLSLGLDLQGGMTFLLDIPVRGRFEPRVLID